MGKDFTNYTSEIALISKIYIKNKKQTIKKIHQRENITIFFLLFAKWLPSLFLKPQPLPKGAVLHTSLNHMVVLKQREMRTFFFFF